jgi:outer membrane protein OmpA-like peptidoglycan-associated protein
MNVPIIRAGRLNGESVFKAYRFVEDPTFIPPSVEPVLCQHQYGDKSVCTSNALPNSPFCSDHGGFANRVFGDEKSGCFSLWGILPRLGMGNLPFPGRSNGGCFQYGCGCLIPLLLLLLLLPFLLCLFKRDCNMLDKLTHRDSLRDTVEVIKYDTVKVVEKETVTKIDTLRMTDTLNQTQSIPDIISLPNVNFETNKAILKEGSFKSLDQLAELMKRNKDMTIIIEGHTDSVGNPRDNLILSQNRADAIKTYLVSKGIEGGRIKAVGYGDTKPAGSNKTEEGRMLNRRVEVRVENKGKNIQIKDEKKGDAK